MALCNVCKEKISDSAKVAKKLSIKLFCEFAYYYKNENLKGFSIVNCQPKNHCQLSG